MTIIIAGYPNNKTQRVIINVEEAAAGFEDIARITWVSDLHEIAALGVHRTPALLINGKIVVCERIPSVYEVKTWIERELAFDLVA